MVRRGRQQTWGNQREETAPVESDGANFHQITQDRQRGIKSDELPACSLLIGDALCEKSDIRMNIFTAEWGRSSSVLNLSHVAQEQLIDRCKSGGFVEKLSPFNSDLDVPFGLLMTCCPIFFFNFVINIAVTQQVLVRFDHWSSCPTTSLSDLQAQ